MKYLNTSLLSRSVRALGLLAAVALVHSITSAQVSYSSAGSNLTFNFDGNLPAAAATLSWTDDSMFPGWYAYRRGGTTEAAGPMTVYRRTDGYSANQRLFHWRAGPSGTDGALGVFPAPESSTMYLVLRIRNNTGTMLTSFTLSYTGEQWINGNSGSNNSLAVSYATAAPANLDFSDGSNFTTVSALAFNSPVDGDGVSPRVNLDGSLSANQVAVGPVTVSGISWADGTDLFIRWLDVDSTGVDHGLAVDDVVFSASTSGGGGSGGNILWAWSGGVTDTTARVIAKVDPQGAAAELEFKTAADPWSSATSINPAATFQSTTAASTTYSTSLHHFDLTGLSANTAYEYRVKSGSNYGPVGTFTTFPSPGTATSFTFVVASCAKGSSSTNYEVDHPVFEKILGVNPRVFLSIGDLHYRDLNTTAKSSYHRAYDQVHLAPSQRALYLGVPLVYSWDDHDYTGNNSGGAQTGRNAVRNAYVENVPHYPLPLDPPGSTTGPIAQSFILGRVKFIILDPRSERYNPANADNEGSSSATADITMLGDGRPGTVDQLGWLFDELASFKAGYDEGTLKLCVINFGMPFVSSSGTDNWYGFRKERKAISDYIVNLMGTTNVKSIIGVAGDAHMLAYDDGTNNKYNTAGNGPSFPMFQCAALKNSGSTKGGPYSGGTKPNPSNSYGQFGQFDITDTGGSTITVTFRGHRVTSAGAMTTEHTHTFNTN